MRTGLAGARIRQVSMTSHLKETLKRFDVLVAPVRFVRETQNTWRFVKQGMEQEKRRKALLRARQQQIDAYFGVSKPPHKLQIGSGQNPLDGWLNTDFEPVSDRVILLDALEPFPFADRVFDYVFSEHMIEHIPYQGGLVMLREACRILKPGGRIRIATPDVNRVVGLLAESKSEAQRRYIRWSSAERLGLYSAERSKLKQRRPEWAIDPVHIRHFFPDESQDCACFVVNNFFRSYGHQFLFDAKTLGAALQEAGFVDVRPARPGESSDAHLRAIDSHSRLIGDEMNAFETLVLEAVRP